MITYQHNFVGDYAIRKGSTWTKRITWNDANGVPVPLAGKKGKMQVRKKTDDPVIVEFNTEETDPDLFGMMTFDDEGHIDLNCSADLSDELEAGSYQYDIEVRDDSVSPAVVDTPLEGEIEIKSNITD